MKKVLKIILSILLVVMLVFACVFSYTAIKQANAVETDTTHVVNFYGADNETVIYSVEVENGQTFNDLINSNFLLNSDFLNSNVNFEPWYNYNDNASVSLSNSGVTISYIGSGLTGFFIQDLDTSFYRNSYITFSASINNQIFSFTYYVPENSVNVGSSSYSTILGIGMRVYIYSNSRMGITFDIFSTLSGSAVINWVKVEKGVFATSYLSQSYLNKLYINSGGLIGDNFEWSESPTSSSKFTFDTPITSDINLYGYSNNGQVIDYDGTLSSDYSNYGNYAIDSVEFLEVSGVPVLHFSIDTNKFDSDLLLFQITVSAFIETSEFGNSYLRKFYFNSPDLSIFPTVFGYSESSVNSSNGPVYVYYSNDRIPYLNILVRRNFGVFHLFFINGVISSASGNSFILDSNNLSSYRFYDNLTSVIDMNSDTNFMLNLNFDFNFDINNIIDAFSDPIINSYGVITGGFLSQLYVGNNSDEFNIFTVYGVSTFNFTLIDFSTYKDVADLSNIYNFYISDFFFFVHKPSYRVDNTLVIYNFDYYNLLYSADFLSYQLQKDGDLYNVNYNGSVNNLYFIYLSNETVNNTQFDEYVSFSLGFSNNLLSLTQAENNIYTCDLGFDFNFTYYVQPLVSSNGVYNYTFEKPGYVEMPFSLYPFYIPVLEMVQNAFIFLLFYCPIISDIISLLNFDMFFGALLNIFNFVTTSAIGQFVYACFGFLIFWSILKGLFPVLVSSGRAAYDNSYFSYMYGNIKDEKKLKRKNKFARNYEAVSRRDRLRSKGIKFGSARRGYSEIHKFSAYHFNSNNNSRILRNHLSRFNYLGYRGKANSKLKKSLIRMSKIKHQK